MIFFWSCVNEMCKLIGISKFLNKIRQILMKQTNISLSYEIGLSMTINFDKLNEPFGTIFIFFMSSGNFNRE